jgi:hypothetical protein
MSFWMNPMEGDEAQVEARFGKFGDSANLDTRLVHGLCRMYHRLKKSFWTHPMELQGDVGYVESCFSPFGAVLVSVQERCTVCVKCSIGSEIILDTPNGTPR